MHTKARFNYIVIMLILAGLSSCTNFFTTIHTNTASNDIQRTQVNKTKENLVPVTFTFKDPYASRAITTAGLLAPDSYTFDFVCSTNAADSFTQSLPVSAEYNFELVIGNSYTLTIEGFNSTTLVCETSSSLTFTVQTGGTLDPSPSIQMIPAGTGNLELTYSWNDSTANITNVTAALIDSAGNPVAGSLTVTPNIAGKTVTITTSTPLPVGYYVLTVNFSDPGGVVLSYKESVSIKAGQTSTSDKAASGTVNLGQSWFAVPPPEVQDAYYIVGPNGDFTVVWRDESQSAGLSYEVRYEASISGLETQYVYSDLGSNVYAAKITGTVGTIDHVFVTAANAAGSNVGIEVNSTIIFTPMISYESNTYNTDYYFEQSAAGILLEPSITGTISDFPSIITGSGTVISPAVSQYTVPIEVNTNGLMTVNTNFSDPSVNLDLYNVKILPQGQCYVDHSGDTTFSSGSNTNQFPTVQTAITRLNNAHVVANPYIINVTGEIPFSGNIQLNSAVLPCNITIDGNGTGILNGSPTFGVMSITGDSKTFILRNLVLQNGNTSFGGGIIISGSNTITLQNCTIQNCTATSNGGGIYINGGTVMLNACTIGRNLGTNETDIAAAVNTDGIPTNATSLTNKAQNGGGIYVNSGNLIIQNGTHVGYNYASQYGGGIYKLNTGNLTCSDSYISGNNSLWSGGGVYISDGTTLSFLNSLFVKNTSDNGGAYYHNTSTTVSFTGSTGFYQNKALVNGGALYISVGEISNNNAGFNIKGNNAQNGGGMYMQTGTITMQAGRITSNTASVSGGGVYMSAGACNIINANIETNTAVTNGGGICCMGGSLTISNSVIGTDENSSPTAINCSNMAANGGGVYLDNGSTLELQENNLVEFNYAVNGAGIYKAGSGTMNILVDNIISLNSAVISGGGIYCSGSGDVTTDYTEVSRNTAGTSGGGVVIYNDSSGTYILTGVMTDNRSPNGAAVSFGANLTASATLNLVMNGYSYDQTNQNPVVFVDADNSGLTLNISPDTEITDVSYGSMYAGFIYLTSPAKITVPIAMNYEIVLDTDDYSYYNNITRIIVDGSTTNISVYDHTLNVNGYIE